MKRKPGCETPDGEGDQRSTAVRTDFRLPISHYGAHNLKFGTTVARTANRGEFSGRPVNILDNTGRLVKRIEFVNGRPYDRNDLEVGFFGQDHWVMSPKLSVDLGTRFERLQSDQPFQPARRAREYRRSAVRGLLRELQAAAQARFRCDLLAPSGGSVLRERASIRTVA